MKRFILASALLCLMQIPGTAAEDGLRGAPQSVGQSIEGTWIAQLTDANGVRTLFEVGSFSPDGSYTGANTDGTHSAHKGVWARTGHRQFTMTILFFTHDPMTSVFNRIVKARLYITLAEDGNSYDSVAERIVMDTAGNILAVIPGIRGHSIRMPVELPQYLPPQ